MKLVDTLAEQALLEDIIETSKPRVPDECRHLHYLLSTPFRYGAPYPAGSRFRRAGQTPGVFYGSRTSATAIAEMAFHRLLFFAESPKTPWPANPGEYTVFASEIRTRAAIDLTKPPFAGDRDRWTHGADYTACQDLADQARSAGIDVVAYPSARDPGGGLNLAVLTCAAFATPEPVQHQTWRLDLGPAGVRALCAFPESRLEFDRPAFARDARIQAMAWERP